VPSRPRGGWGGFGAAALSYGLEAVRNLLSTPRNFARYSRSFRRRRPASGQWFGIPELTGQMKSALLPREQMERAFAAAEGK
jgi:hypothetical protein